MPSSFVRRKIDVTFTLAQGGFGSDGSDTVKLSGLRVSVQINNAGLPSGATAKIRIEGMTQQLMSRLSVLVRNVVQPTQNNVLIEAGDDINGMSVVFDGGIYEAFADFNGVPNVAFVASALSTLLPNAVPITPTSYSGGASVSTIMAAIAGKAGLGFQDAGVSVTLQSPYFPGTAGEQIDRCAAAAKIIANIDKRTLYIWPKGGSQSSDVPLVSAATGLLGYPSYNQNGVTFATIFNPSLSFYEPIQIQSDYLAAAWVNQYGQLPGYPTSNGRWVIYNLSHDIQSEVPDAPWESMISAQRQDNVGNVVTI